MNTGLQTINKQLLEKVIGETIAIYRDFFQTTDIARDRMPRLDIKAMTEHVRSVYFNRMQDGDLPVGREEIVLAIKKHDWVKNFNQYWEEQLAIKYADAFKSHLRNTRITESKIRSIVALWRKKKRAPKWAALNIPLPWSTMFNPMLSTEEVLKKYSHLKIKFCSIKMSGGEMMIGFQGGEGSLVINCEKIIPGPVISTSTINYTTDVEFDIKYALDNFSWVQVRKGGQVIFSEKNELDYL